jgi:acylphosphatase
MQRRTAMFSGNVQGVGFRYTATRLAQQYDLTGYVRNRPEGSVEIVAEGRPEEIDAFLEELSHQMAGYVRTVKQQTGQVLGDMQGFSVRY